MAYRWLELARSAALLGVVLACGAHSGELPTPDGAATSVQFDDAGVLTLAPKQMATIHVTANVSGVTISLAGNYLDAFLDSDAVDVAGGHASFTLHAPSSASTFSLLAVAGQATARLDVAVSATGFSTVRVTMGYQGKRPVPIVAASAFVETTCAQLAGAATDGSPLVVGTFGEKLVISSVPTDGQVAVNVRIAHYATGCIDLASLTPNETRDVTIPVFDLPLDLAHTTLETRFTFAPATPDATALATYLDQLVGGTVLSASFPASSNESARLLDAMQSASTSSSQFASARGSKSWDGKVQTWLNGHTPSMSSRVSTWLHESATAGVGDVTGHLASDPTLPVFTPKTVGTLDASSAGVSAPLPFEWNGQPNDVLSLAGDLVIVPSSFACAGADARAQVDVPTSTGVASALSTAIDCAGIGTTLAPSGYAFGTCDAACVAGLCDVALANLWSAGANTMTKASDALTLKLSVAAPAQVSDTAAVQSYAGTWVGSFLYGTSTIGTQGIAKGAYGAVPN